MSIPGRRSVPERELFLAAVADDTSGPELVRVIETLRSQGYEVTGEVMRRVPKGYPADHPCAQLVRQTDHPRAELLRYRNLVAARPSDVRDGCTHRTGDLVFAAFEELRSMLSWFAEHVPAEAL
jgi:hypothetical protein